MRDGIFLSTSSSSEGVYSVCGGSRKAYQTQRRQTLFITCQLPFHNIVSYNINTNTNTKAYEILQTLYYLPTTAQQASKAGGYAF